MSDTISLSRIYNIPVELESEKTLFEAMTKESDASFDNIDAIFAENGSKFSNTEFFSGAQSRTGVCGQYLDVFLQGILPFHIAETSDVVWQFYNSSIKHRGIIYFKRSQVVKQCADSLSR